MAKRKQKSERPRKPRRPAPVGPRESPMTEAATVAWTVAVTMVVVCDVAAILAHAYLLRNPEEKGAALFGSLMLFGGAAIGVTALILLPVVYRLRRMPPPLGFTVFSVCAAAAPVLALVARLLAN
jgi:putative exporter of polyketide antibiotics